MRILITGASGFVGRAIVDDLQSKGFDIHTCGRKEVSGLPNYFAVDISSADSVEKLRGQFKNIDCIIHSAGLAHQSKTPSDNSIFERVNVDGTRQVAEFAAEAGCSKLVLISSISVYGENKPNPCPEDAECRPEGGYAVSKYRAEIVAREICERNGIDLVILRLATVYGEGDPGNVLRLIKLIDSGRFFWTGKGENNKSLIYRADAAAACSVVLAEDLSGTHVYNVTDVPHTMRQIVETISADLGRKIPSIPVPEGLIKASLKIAGLLPVVGGKARRVGETLRKWLSDDVLSGAKIENELGFRTKTPLAEGIKNEIEWYLNSKR